MFTLILILAAVTAALFAVGRHTVPASERTAVRSAGDVLRTAVRGNATLAAGPAWQYDKIAARS
jgi:predicted membrane-bound mannosyltransferase